MQDAYALAEKYHHPQVLPLHLALALLADFHHLPLIRSKGPSPQVDSANHFRRLAERAQEQRLEKEKKLKPSERVREARILRS